MKNRYLFGVIINAFIIFANGEDKWVWSKERKNSHIQSDTTKISVAKPILNDLDEDSSERKVDDGVVRLLNNDDDYRRARYEVQETVDYLNGRPLTPYKPKPYITNRPILNRPFSEKPYSERPLPERPLPERPLPERPLPERPEEYVPLPSGVGPSGIRRQPSGQSVGILTGPVPSWEKPPLHKNGDPTNFEHCKCSFAFNCKSPGIQFGSCDQGKQYCCYNEFNTNKDGPASTNSFGSNIDRFDRLPPILVGPGGPGDRRDVRPILPPTTPPRGHNYGPFISPYEEPEGPETLEFNRRSYTIIPQKPVLPPYMGLHNDYRSS